MPPHLPCVERVQLLIAWSAQGLCPAFGRGGMHPITKSRRSPAARTTQKCVASRRNPTEFCSLTAHSRGSKTPPTIRNLLTPSERLANARRNQWDSIS